MPRRGSAAPRLVEVDELLADKDLWCPKHKPNRARVRFPLEPSPVAKNTRTRKESLMFILASHNKQEADTAANALQSAFVAFAGGQTRRILWAYRRLQAAALTINRFMKKSVMARRAFIERGVALWSLIESEAKEARAQRPLPTEEARARCVHLASQQGAGRQAVLRRRKGWREVQSGGGVHFCDEATKLRLITLLWEERRHVTEHTTQNPSSVPTPTNRHRSLLAPGAVERVLSTTGVPEYVKSTVAAALFAEGRTGDGRRRYHGPEGAAEKALREAAFGESAPQWSDHERSILEQVCWPQPKPASGTDHQLQRVRILPRPLGRKEVEQLALIDWEQKEQRDRKREEDEAESRDTLASVSRYYLSVQPHLDAPPEPPCPAPRPPP
eukprot:Hpha_TRINITY_DN12283_c0_g1::TRINITY_DN12283_c0_g1_i1::g.16834::m.16834